MMPGRHFRILLAMGLLVADAAAEQSKPAPALVAEDGAQTFKLAWPDLAKVGLVARGPNQHDFPREIYEMNRDADGTYRVTIAPVPPGVHFYKFRVNGSDVLDPQNRAVQDFFNGPWSRLEVPDSAPRPWAARTGVARGVVEERIYESRILGHDCPVLVYLPPGYAQNRAQALPVLYLLHGSTYDQRSWIELGRVREIMDNLIADGRIAPAIVVMPFGYSALPSGPGEPAREYRPWAEHVLNELLPWVERTYGVAAAGDKRAVAGLSLGGAQALQLGLQSAGKFFAIGAFSAAENGTRNLVPLAANSGRPSLVWFGCGRGDKHFAHNRELCQSLSQNGLAASWHEYEGRHTWNVWRQSLADFLPLAFPPRASNP